MRYEIKIYLDEKYWDWCETDNMKEAESWVEYLENTNISIWDRINHDALNEYINCFNVIDAEKIEVTTEICW